MTEDAWCSGARLAEVNTAATAKREYIERLWARIANGDHQIRAQAREIQRLTATLSELRAGAASNEPQPRTQLAHTGLGGISA